MINFAKSTYDATSICHAFPDVCKTPTPPGPVPTPYPNVGTQSPLKSGGARAVKAPTSLQQATLANPGSPGGVMAKVTFNAARQQIRGQLQTLHGQIISAPGGNPNRWHQLIDEYVIRSAELYRTLTE